MNKTEISSKSAGDNFTPAFINAIRELSERQALNSAPVQPMPAPIAKARKNGSARPPREPKPGEDATFPAPQIDEIQDSTQPIIAAKAKGKPAAALLAAFVSEEFIDLVALGALQKLPAIQQELLEEAIIQEPWDTSTGERAK